MHLTNKIINLNSLRIFYLEGGDTSDRRYPILFLHGWGLSSEAFQAGLTLLSQDYRVIAPDLPGFGKSNHSISSWNYEDYANAIKSFIESLSIKKVHLVGQSMGGGVAITLAVSSPSVVQSLTLIDSTGIPIGSFSNLFLQRLIELPAQTLATKFTSHHKEMTRSFLYNSIFGPKNAKAALRLPLTADLRPILSHINVPCLILWGANDRTVPLSSGRELSKRIAGAKLIVIEGAHHEWSALMPEKFASIVSNFVKEIE